MTLKILKKINQNPNISSTEIGNLLKIQRNLVKYHLDKLNDLELIEKEKIGRNVHIKIKNLDKLSNSIKMEMNDN